MEVWAIRLGYRYTPVKVFRETDATVWFEEVATSGRTREARGNKHKFLPWRGGEADARALAEKLTSADSERDRRIMAARQWHRGQVEKLTRNSDGNPRGEDRDV